MKKLLATGERENQMNLREQLVTLSAEPNCAVDLFYDWFCKDSSLPCKAAALVSKVTRVWKSPRFDWNKVYVFFKNCCPLDGSLYDQFKLCDIETGDVLFCVTPRGGHRVDQGKASVYGRHNGFQEPLVEGTWKDVVEWFNYPSVFESRQQARLLAETLRQQEEARLSERQYAEAI